MADVKLLQYDGTEKQYLGVERVQLAKTDGGTAIFSEGEAVEGIEISPDFSAGDMTVDAPAGTLVKSAVIKRPDALIPENIPKGINIGGVDGSKVIPDPVETEVALDFSAGAMEVVPLDGKVFSKVSIPVPEGLVPEKIAEGEYIAGVGPGIYKGADTGFDATDENLSNYAYQLDFDKKRADILYVVYDNILSADGETRVDVPTTLGNFEITLVCT